jgi:hypothetical protein
MDFNISQCPGCLEECYTYSAGEEHSISCGKCLFFIFKNVDLFNISCNFKIDDDLYFVDWSAKRFDFWTISPYKMSSFEVEYPPTFDVSIIEQAKCIVDELMPLVIFS